MKKQNKIIICPGSINPDFVIRSEKPLRLFNRSMTFHGISSVYAGGKGRNQAVAAKRSAPKEIEVILVGCVGKDSLGNDVILGLRKERIETKFVFQKKEKQTGKCILSIFKGGYQIVGLDLAANTLLGPGDIKKAEKEIAASKILVCQIENTKEATAKALKIAKRHGIFTILNPSLVPRDPSYVIKIMFPNTDLLVANVQEAGQLLKRELKNKNDFVGAAKKFSNMGIEFIIITLGEKGSLIMFQNKYKFLKALRVKEVDTTACGDVYVGALAAAFLENVNTFDKFISAVKFASVAAALAVTKIGASESAPKRNEIFKNLKCLK